MRFLKPYRGLVAVTLLVLLAGNAIMIAVALAGAGDLNMDGVSHDAGEHGQHRYHHG